MAEEQQTVETVEETTVPAEPVGVQPQDEKKYTDADVDAIIDKKFAKWKAEQEAKETEAKKLAKMNAEQKAAYEAQKQADYIAELEAKINRSGLEKEASKMLSEGGIVANDDILAFVVRDSAEATQEAVASFVALVETVATTKVQEALKGKTPTKTNAGSQGLTAEQFASLGYGERVKLYNEQPDLYAQLTQ